MLSTKIGTKGIVGFVEAILFVIGCGMLIMNFLDGGPEIHYIFFCLMNMDSMKLIREVRGMMSTNAPELVCCV